MYGNIPWVRIPPSPPNLHRGEIMYKVGYEIRSRVLADIRCIDEIIPVKYDGMLDCYVVCSPKDATSHMVKFQGGDYILIATNCGNKELLIDII